MKIEIRKGKWLISAALLWLAFAPLAQAFYNPSTGRWLSRDPIAENAFFGFFATALEDEEDVAWREQSLKPVYSFVLNNPITSLDVLGLAGCSVTIIYGHNNTVPQGRIKNDSCSPTSVVSCGPTEKWDPAIPDVPIEGTGNGRNNAGSLSIAKANELVNSWFEKAKAHASKICKSASCCCKSVVISVECKFGWDLLGKAAATPPCGKKYVLDCATGKEASK